MVELELLERFLRRIPKPGFSFRVNYPASREPRFSDTSPSKKSRAASVQLLSAFSDSSRHTFHRYITETRTRYTTEKKGDEERSYKR